MYFKHCPNCDKDYYAQADAVCPNCWNRPWLAKKDVDKIMDDFQATTSVTVLCGTCGHRRPYNRECQRCVKVVTPSSDSPLDKQVGGDHYKKYGDYQPWAVYAKWFSPDELRGAMKKEVITYLMREKGGREDIEKAAHTLQLYLELSK